MKANWIDNYGGADAMHFGEQPQPQPGPRDVLVRVAAARIFTTNRMANCSI